MEDKPKKKLNSKNINFMIVMASVIIADIISRKFFDGTGTSACICYCVIMVVLFGISKLIKREK